MVTNLSHIGAVLRENSRFWLLDSCISFFPLRKVFFTQLESTLFVPGFSCTNCSWVITSDGKSLAGMVLQIQAEELQHIIYYKTKLKKMYRYTRWINQMYRYIFYVINTACQWFKLMLTISSTDFQLINNTIPTII